ncbi:hypothetical protein GCM10027020_22720 [Nocardioides salsibiostraticola]
MLYLETRCPLRWWIEMRGLQRKPEARSMQNVARQTVREYTENHSRAERLDRVIAALRVRRRRCAQI